LALVDEEALDRTEEFLDGFGVPTTSFEFSRATPNRRALTAIRTQRKESVERIRHLIAWPRRPSDGWRKGFLAGIFDAEGSSSCGIFRIANTDPAIIETTIECLRHFGFRVAIDAARGRQLKYVRILGGFRERLRFFLMTDPAITRKRTFDGLAI